MDIKKLSTIYIVRTLNHEDVDIIFDLCKKNEIFYQYHPPFVTKESILEDMEALPPNKEFKDKFYVGFFKESSLLAIMDLILDYPQNKVAFIGLFMMNTEFQGKGIGTSIINQCSSYLSDLGYSKIRLAIDAGNPQSEAFWTKNSFSKTGEVFPNDISTYISMERVLSLMPYNNSEQPEIIQLTETLRLKKYDGHYEKALIGYQDPYVYQNSEGIFDDEKKPDLNYVKGMCQYLNKVGELYFIEVLKNEEYVSIGDVTIKPENPPIAIWFSEYRNKGIGTLVMQAVIERLRALGYQKITGTTVYKWNDASLNLHRKLGFQVVRETEDEYILELELS